MATKDVLVLNTPQHSPVVLVAGHWRMNNCITPL
jgi:hypothetical protein